eukprot:323796_1
MAKYDMRKHHDIWALGVQLFTLFQLQQAPLQGYQDKVSTYPTRNAPEMSRVIELDELFTRNGDRMQHAVKGIIGMKISGVQNVRFRCDFVIDNLRDSVNHGVPMDLANIVNTKAEINSVHGLCAINPSQRRKKMENLSSMDRETMLSNDTLIDVLNDVVQRKELPHHPTEDTCTMKHDTAANEYIMNAVNMELLSALKDAADTKDIIKGDARSQRQDVRNYSSRDRAEHEKEKEEDESCNRKSSMYLKDQVWHEEMTIQNSDVYCDIEMIVISLWNCLTPIRGQWIGSYEIRRKRMHRQYLDLTVI